MTVTAALGISLNVACDDPACSEFAFPLLRQMGSGRYDECAVMSLPRTVDDWESEHRTARKRAWRAERLGYQVRRFERAERVDEIHAVNLSTDTRQGRPMSIGYRERPSFGSDDSPCELHGVHAYGVFDRTDILYGYLFMYRAGDLALVSQVLGHADAEPDGIMYLLFREALAAEGAVAPGVAVYNRYDSGGDGLRFLKDRIGFEPVDVEWLP